MGLNSIHDPQIRTNFQFSANRDFNRLNGYHDLNSGIKAKDSEVLGKQSGLRKQFIERRQGEPDEFTDITDLYDSMMMVGYVGIDQIVVRELEGQDKYLVIEGNRRVSAVKLIREKALKNFNNREDDIERYEKNKETFEELTVLLLKTKGLTDEQLEQQVSMILGLRHFGSVLDWKPLNRAYNAFQNYMSIDPQMDDFTFDDKRLRDVASRLSVSKAVVKQALQTYILFRQLISSTNGIEDEHYSLIEAGISLCRFNYFSRNESTFEFDDPSLSKLADLCQFDQRATAKAGSLIISEPKKFGVLGKLLMHSQLHNNEFIRARAHELIATVVRGEKDDDGNLLMNVDNAHSTLLAEINRKEWVGTLNRMLEKQEAELSIDKYEGEGNHLIAKNELVDSIVHLRMIYGV